MDYIHTTFLEMRHYEKFKHWKKWMVNVSDQISCNNQKYPPARKVGGRTRTSPCHDTRTQTGLIKDKSLELTVAPLSSGTFPFNYIVYSVSWRQPSVPIRENPMQRTWLLRPRINTCSTCDTGGGRSLQVGDGAPAAPALGGGGGGVYRRYGGCIGGFTMGLTLINPPHTPQSHPFSNISQQHRSSFRR